MSSSNAAKDGSSGPTPMLRVMRLQQPELHNFSQSNALCLPDSLVVNIGEVFTAYLGVLNGSKLPIRKLKVVSQLQTPTTRHSLPDLEHSQLEGLSRVDHIISQHITEQGQHILRVEVHYENQTFRKFYRFQVKRPITVTTRTIRRGENRCLVQATVQVHDATLLIPQVQLVTKEGLVSERVHPINPGTTALELFDSVDTYHDGDEIKYLFQVSVAPDDDDNQLRGIAGGDTLGTISILWRKAMGESGTVYSADIVVPSSLPKIMHQSGYSVDAAAAPPGTVLPLPVTVEPIDPPSKLFLFEPRELQFLIVNHSSQSRHLQVQFRNSHVCGPTFVNLGQVVQANGGSQLTKISILAKVGGLIRFDGCVVVDLVNHSEWVQPTLFCCFVQATEAPTAVVDDTTLSLTA